MRNASRDTLKQEREERIKKEKAELTMLQTYDPFGKSGAGAPLRDTTGNIITNRKAGTQVFTNYDPNDVKAKQQSAY
jgi:hypothetical protein